MTKLFEAVAQPPIGDPDDPEFNGGELYSGIEAGDLMKAMTLYQKFDELYTFLNRMQDRVQSESLNSSIDEWLDMLMDPTSQLEMIMQEAYDAGKMSSAMANKWIQMHG